MIIFKLNPLICCNGNDGGGGGGGNDNAGNEVGDYSGNVLATGNAGGSATDKGLTGNEVGSYAEGGGFAGANPNTFKDTAPSDTGSYTDVGYDYAVNPPVSNESELSKLANPDLGSNYAVNPPTTEVAPSPGSAYSPAEGFDVATNPPTTARDLTFNNVKDAFNKGYKGGGMPGGILTLLGDLMTGDYTNYGEVNQKDDNVLDLGGDMSNANLNMPEDNASSPISLSKLLGGGLGTAPVAPLTNNAALTQPTPLPDWLTTSQGLGPKYSDIRIGGMTLADLIASYKGAQNV